MNNPFDDGNDDAWEQAKELLALVMSDTGTPLKERMKTVSFILLPLMDPLVSAESLDNLSQGAAMARIVLSQDLGPMQYAFAAGKIRSTSRNDIRSNLKVAFADASFEKALENVKSQRNTVEGLTQKDHIALNVIANDLVPVKARNFLEEAYGSVGTSAKADVLKARARFRNHTDEELAAKAVLKAQAFPLEEVTDAVHATLQKVTPQSLKTLQAAFAKAVGEDDFAIIAKSGILAVHESLTAVSNDASVLKTLLGSKNVAALRPALKSVFQAVEDAFVAAKLTLDTAKLEPALKKYAAFKP